MSRYDHWFWNSNFIMWISRMSGRLNSWLWSKQYSRERGKKN